MCHLIIEVCVLFFMAKRGSEGHEKKVKEYLSKLEKEGYKVINLNAKSPDGIAVKDGKVFAVEILKKIKTERKNPESIRKHGKTVWRFSGGFTMKAKRSIYSMFDDVLFETYKD